MGDVNELLKRRYSGEIYSRFLKLCNFVYDNNIPRRESYINNLKLIGGDTLKAIVSRLETSRWGEIYGFTVDNNDFVFHNTHRPSILKSGKAKYFVLNVDCTQQEWFDVMGMSEHEQTEHILKYGKHDLDVS